MKIFLILALLFSTSNLHALGLGTVVMKRAKGVSSATIKLVATGGTILDVGSDRVHMFYSTTTVKTFSVTTAGWIKEMLLIGGGGQAGSHTYGGGGGAGKMVEVGALYLPVGDYTVGVGTAGLSAVGGTNGIVGYRGGDSTFNYPTYALIARGGGGGGSYNAVAATDGGSGGGSATNYGAHGNPTSETLMAGATAYGYAGGDGYAAYSGGGGGAGGVGGNGGANPAAGGAGRENDITGSSVTYAIGGTYNYGNVQSLPAINNGSGGGGGRSDNAPSSAGIVIIRYLR
jgi:hypothetical protein